MRKYLITFFTLVIMLNAVAQHLTVVDSIFSSVFRNKETKQTTLFELENEYYKCRSNGLIVDSAACVYYLTLSIDAAKVQNHKEFESIFSSHLCRVYCFKYKNELLARFYVNQALKVAKTNKALGTAWLTLGTFHDNFFNKHRDSMFICYLKADEYLENVSDAAVTLSVYSSLADYYSQQGLYDKKLIYAKKSIRYLNIGKRLTLYDSLRAYQTLGLAYLSLSKTALTPDKYIDSSISALSKVFTLVKNKPNSYNPSTLVSDTYFNLAALLSSHPKQFSKDTVLQVLAKAKERAIESNSFNGEIAALILLLKTTTLVEMNNYEAAATILKEVPEVYSDFLVNPYVGSKYYELNKILAHHNGNHKQALAYLNKQLILNDSIYSLEKLSITQQTETKFRNVILEEQLKQEKIYSKLRKRMNYIYIALAFLALIGIIFLYKSGQLTKKVMTQKELLLKEERNNALLRVSINENTAIEAMMEKDIAAQELVIAEQEKLLSQQQRDGLQHVLMVNTLQVERKNDLIKDLQEKIKQINVTKEAQHVKIEQAMDRSVDNDEELDYMQQILSNTNPKFFQSLLAKSSQSLTNLDMKYCAYIKIGMSNREIAQIMNVEQKSVRMAKYRLKQKLNVSKDIDLDTYIIKIAEELNA
jgi:DNA-binding CsgD family transcriptional regulator